MVKNKYRDIVIMGFALFAIFFGAGNLIFPPYLGQIAGTDWRQAMFGFLTTDPLLPVVGVIATALVGGAADDLGKRVSANFAKAIATLAMLIIGPFFAVPRTAATVHEIAIKPIFPSVPTYATSLVFFVITFILIFNQGKVIDIIGKYLTPVLIMVLALLIGKCIVHPIGAIAAPAASAIGGVSTYFKGFTEGYQTMDALGAGLMAGIVVTDMKRRGYEKKRDRDFLSIGVAIVACLLLALVYGGLTYVGATASSVMPVSSGLTRVELLIGVSKAVLGNVGGWVMAICVSIACLTTSTGLTATAGNFFSNSIFNGKIRYKIIVAISVIISFIVSVNGTERIIKFAIPVLSLIYPLFVVLIFLTLLDRFIKYDSVFRGAVIFTLPISIVMSLKVLYGMFGIQSAVPFLELVAKLPFAAAGFPWIVPAVVGGILGFIFGAVFKR